MKKFIVVILFGVCLLGLLYMRGLNIVRKSMPNDTLIVFFQKDCPHCHAAMTFIDETVRSKYPDLKIEFLDVDKRENMLKLSVVSKQHNLGSRIGTPIWVLNGKASMGWSSKSEKTLLSLIKSLPKKNLDK